MTGYCKPGWWKSPGKGKNPPGNPKKRAEGIAKRKKEEEEANGKLD